MPRRSAQESADQIENSSTAEAVTSQNGRQAEADEGRLAQVLERLEGLAQRVEALEPRDTGEGDTPSEYADARELADGQTGQDQRGGEDRAPRDNRSGHRVQGGARDAPAPRDAQDDEVDDAGGGNVSISTARLVDIMQGEGRILPCPHDASNPFPRAPSLHARACHYSPAAAGDAVHAEIDKSLQSVSKETAIALTKRELRTLVPALSSLFDLQVFVDSAAQAAAGDADVAAVLGTIGQQLAAGRELLSERLDELAGAAKGVSDHAAVADLIYGQERTLTGARSALGDFLALSTSTRVLSAHVGAVARARATAVRGTTPQGPPNSPRTAAQQLRRLGNRNQTPPSAPSGGGRGQGGAGGGTGAPYQPAGGKGRGQGGGRGGGRGQSGAPAGASE